MRFLTHSPTTNLACTGAIAAVIFKLVATANGAVLIDDYSLGGSGQVTTSWTTLNNTNASLTPASGTGTMTSTGMPLTSGLYSFSGDYSVTVSQSAGFDIQTVVFQLEAAPNPDLAWPYGGGPLLSINGGDFLIAPGFFGAGESEKRGNFDYTAYVWQWDLSGVSANVTSVGIYTPVGIHSSIVGAQIDAGNAFTGMVSPVPEPSAFALASLAGAGLLVRRRR